MNEEMIAMPYLCTQSINHEGRPSTHPTHVVMTFGHLSNKPRLYGDQVLHMCNDSGPMFDKSWAYGEFGLGA